MYFIKILMLMFFAIALTACDKVERLNHKIQQRFFSQPAANSVKKIPMVGGVKVFHDIAYSEHSKQKMDIYVPENAKNAPVIMMLHGGGWASGDKASPLIYIHKVNRWVPKGFIVISAGTRLLPEADVYTQVQDFAHAVANAQQRVKDWGGDPNQFFLMGHSSGGTIVSVLSTNPRLVTNLGGKRWLGSISLDSSSLDVLRTMRLWSPDMFKGAYGNDATRWAEASPYEHLSADSIPMFIACSAFRQDSSCEQGQLFKDKAQTFNVRVEISPQKLNHGEVNDALGVESAYTAAVETFMTSLSPEVAEKLK